jgi:uncharacterized phiE125 gp8 family phage protein
VQPVLKTPPAGDVVSLGELKTHLRILDDTSEDALIELYRSAAIQYLDGYSGILGRCLETQTWTCGFVDWCERLRLPFPDVSAAVVTYTDAAGDVQTVAEGLFEVVSDLRGSFVRLSDDFTDPPLFDDMEFPILVDVTAGYGTQADVPRPLKSAILMIADHLYHHRGVLGSDSDLPFGVMALIAPFRRRSV